MGRTLCSSPIPGRTQGSPLLMGDPAGRPYGKNIYLKRIGIIYPDDETVAKVFGEKGQGSSSWAFGPPIKNEKLYAPSPQPSSPVGGEGVSALIFWFLLATDYWLPATFRSSGPGVPAGKTPGSLQGAPPRPTAPIIKPRTAEGGGSTKTTGKATGWRIIGRPGFRRRRRRPPRPGGCSPGQGYSGGARGWTSRNS